MRGAASCRRYRATFSRAGRRRPSPARGRGRGQGARLRRRPKPQLLRALEPERRVGGGDDDAAAVEMRLHDRGEGGLRGGVERGRRLVEEPERPVGDEEAGERDAPLLPGRERARREIDHMGEADPRERRALASREDRRRARRPRRRGSRSRSARLSARRRGRDNAPVRRACARDRRRPAQSLRPRAAESRRARAAGSICRRRSALSRSAPSPRPTSNEKPGKQAPPAAFDRQVPRAQAHRSP